MTFEAFNYTHKRVRTLGTREWKLWFSETEDGLEFRMLTKDNVSDCYVTLTGTALPVPGDPPVQESDNGDAFSTDFFQYRNAEGGIAIYLEQDHRDLVWTRGSGHYGKDDCGFQAPGPLMPETAG
jgi:hypothetical protein